MKGRGNGALGLWIVAAGSLTVALLSWAHAKETHPVLPPAFALEVWKSKHEMRLIDGGRVTHTFAISLGKQPAAAKVVKGDGRTPVGTYYICEKRPRSRYRHFLGINYPNLDDADRALAERLINGNQWAQIFMANRQGTMPPASTPLGGRLGIHGHGGPSLIPIDWTAGCIAVSDPDIDYLYRTVPIGTPVTIHD